MTARMNRFARTHSMSAAAHTAEACFCRASQMNTSVLAILGTILLVSIFVALTLRITGMILVSLMIMIALVNLINLSCHPVLKEPNPAL